MLEDFDANAKDENECAHPKNIFWPAKYGKNRETCIADNVQRLVIVR